MTVIHFSEALLVNLKLKGCIIIFILILIGFFYRFESALMRERFDKNKDIKDMRLAKHLLEEGEKELFSKQHYQPITFANSATGIAYGRVAHCPDYVLDYWHPLEKAMYPKYFARREQMKAEYEEWYYKTYPEEKIKDH